MLISSGLRGERAREDLHPWNLVDNEMIRNGNGVFQVEETGANNRNFERAKGHCYAPSGKWKEG